MASVTFTINPTPSNATVKMIATGYNQNYDADGNPLNSITVEEGTVVRWEVSAEYYQTITGSDVVDADITKNVTLSLAKYDLKSTHLGKISLKNLYDNDLQTSNKTITGSINELLSKNTNLDDLAVHKAGTETITGTKTFTAQNVYSSNELTDSRILQMDMGADTTIAPSELRMRSYRIIDKNGKLLGDFRNTRFTDGKTISSVFARSEISGEEKQSYVNAVVDSDGSIYAICPTPSSASDNTDKIATTAWVNSASSVVHKTGNETINGTKTFNSVIIGTTPSANSALSSKEVPTIAWINTPNNNNLVHKTGEETITGEKTFTFRPISKITAFKAGETPIVEGTGGIRMTDKDGDEIGYFALREPTDGNAWIGFGVHKQSDNSLHTELTLYYNADGTTYATCPTPASASDSSSKIATTAWVNSASSVVHKTGEETITGLKNFADKTLRVKNNGVAYPSSNRTAVTYGQLNFIDNSGKIVSLLETCFPADTTESRFNIAMRSADDTTWEHPISIIRPSTGSTDKSYVVFENTIQGTAYRALWGDLAENYVADKVYPKGTLVKFGGEKEVTIADDYANAVISTNPGVILNGEKGDTNAMLALTGRVPVRVIGKCEKFDRLSISEIAGVARANLQKEKIAIALESKQTEEEGLVECVVKLTF